MALAGVIIGSIALGLALMALPTLLQMIFGKPVITIDFGIKAGVVGDILQCQLFNFPIKQRLLRILGVRRMVAEDVGAHLTIIKLNKRDEIIDVVMPHIMAYRGTDPAQQTFIPPSIFPVVFPVAFINEAQGLVRLPSWEGSSKDTPLESARYCAFVEIIMEDKTYTSERNFRVSKNPPFAEWEVDLHPKRMPVLKLELPG